MLNSSSMVPRPPGRNRKAVRWSGLSRDPASVSATLRAGSELHVKAQPAGR